jgi:hypothetical protein
MRLPNSAVGRIGCLWLLEEDASLQHLVNQAIDLVTIANKLKRNVKGVISRLKQLRVPFHQLHMKPMPPQPAARSSEPSDRQLARLKSAGVEVSMDTTRQQASQLIGTMPATSAQVGYIRRLSPLIVIEPRLTVNDASNMIDRLLLTRVR